MRALGTNRRWLAVAVAAASLLGFTACTGSTAAPALPAIESGTQAAVTPKVPRVVLAVSAPATEGNDLGPMSAPALWPMKPMYENLIGMDAKDGKLIPQLASSWSLEPDGASYRFKLQQGVHYQKGYGEFTATQLKVIQEAISLSVFAVFAFFYLKETPTWRTALAFALIIGAVLLIRGENHQ